MATPIVQYLFATGSGSTLFDSAPGTAVNLPFNSGTASVWTSIASGGGISFDGTGACGNTSVGGTKIDTALSGTKKMVIEAVLDFPITSGAAFWGFRDNSPFQLTGDEYVASQVHSGLMAVSLGGVSAGVHVAHFVLDGTGPASWTCYIDGALFASSSGTASGSSFNFAALQLAIGADWNGGGGVWRNITGRIFYWALYGDMTTGEIAANATALAANNDVDPNAPPADSLVFSRRPLASEQTTEERRSRRMGLPGATPDAFNFTPRRRSEERPGDDQRQPRRALPRSADSAFGRRPRREEVAAEEPRRRSSSLPSATIAEAGLAFLRRRMPEERVAEQRQPGRWIVSQAFVAAAFVLTKLRMPRHEAPREEPSVFRRRRHSDFIGAAVYSDAPDDRYVWAAPVISSDPPGGSFVVPEPEQLVVPPDERTLIA